MKTLFHSLLKNVLIILLHFLNGLAYLKQYCKHSSLFKIVNSHYVLASPHILKLMSPLRVTYLEYTMRE